MQTESGKKAVKQYRDELVKMATNNRNKVRKIRK